MSADTTVPLARRRAVCIGVSTFGADRQPEAEAEVRMWDDLGFAADRVVAISEALARFGYDCRTPDEPRNLTGAALADSIWAAARETGPDGILVVHVLSHGHVTETGTLYAIGADGEHHPLSEVGGWLKRIVDFRADYPRTLFLLDLCHAGNAARMTWQMATADEGNRVWVIAACGPRQNAYNGRFSEAVGNVLRAFADHEIDIDQSWRHIPLTTVAREIRREVKRLAEARSSLPQEVTGSLVDISADLADLPFFPNPGHRRGPRSAVRSRVDVAIAPFVDDADEILDAGHFIERASGHADVVADHVAGCFSGRRRELQILSAWFDGHDDARLRVVTGSPGVGKSALLGVLVCAAHPLLREPTRAIWQHVDRWPAQHRNMAAIHARQRSLDEICASLARQLELDQAPFTGDVDHLVARIRDRAEPPTVLIDALDEANNHQEVLYRLILPLLQSDRPDGRPTCRLLVALRPWPEFDVLRALAAGQGGLTDLDAVDPKVVRYDIENYISDLLRGHEPYDEVEYAGARQTIAAGVAKTLVPVRGSGDRDKQWGEFLVAGLYARHVVAAYEPIQDVARAATIAGQAPRSLPQLLELDLSARAGSPWLRPLLAALAHTRGDGMPARTAAQAAEAFLPAGLVDGAQAAEDVRVAETLSMARFYLRRTADADGTTLYRLFHQGLADYLRDHPTSADVAAPPRRRMVESLLASLDSSDGSGRRWDLAEPYLLRHAGQHVHDADCADLLADDAEYFVYADPAAAKEFLDAHPLEWLTGDTFSQLTSMPQAATHATRRQLLALEAAGAGASRTARRLARPTGQTPLSWQPVWTIDNDLHPAAIVTAVAAAADHPLVATGHGDGRVVLRDARTGAEINLLPGGDQPIVAVAFGLFRNSLVLVTLSATGHLDLWNAMSSACLLSVRCWVPPGRASLEFTVIAGRPTVIVAAYGVRAIAYDLVTGSPLGIMGSLSAALSVRADIAMADEEIVTVSIGDDGPQIARATEVARGHPREHRRADLCFAVGDNTFVAEIYESSNLRVWDALTGQLVGSVAARGMIDSVAATADGGLLLLTTHNVAFLGYGPSEPEVEPLPIEADEQASPQAETTETEPPSDNAPASSLSDIVDAFLSSSTKDRKRSRVRRGQDAMITLEITLREAAFGAQRDIQVDTAVVCPTCHGDGAAPGTSPVTCDMCRGRGETPQVTRSFLGDVTVSRPCPQCEGFGTIVPYPCVECAGDGRVRTRRTLTVKIPPGVDNGTRIQLAGEGEVGPGAGPAGDLYIEIVEEPHTTFRRQGDDLHCTLTIQPTVATRGGKVRLEALDGPVDLDIRPGILPGQTLTVRGRGVQHLHGTSRGDLVVHLQLPTPEELYPDLEEHMRQLGRLRGEEQPSEASAPGRQGLFSRIKDAMNNS